MKSRNLIFGHKKSGFTLVELLVSITILSLILLTLAKAIGFVSQIWVSGIGTVDNYSKARDILSIMDRDIQQMVLRPDTAAFVDSSGNSACAFYTNIQGNPGTGLPGNPDTRTVSLVQYALNTPTTQPALVRKNYGMNFVYTAAASPTGATPTVGNTSSLPQPANSSLETDTVATGVIQFEWQFVDGGGNIISPTSTSNNFSYNFNAPSAATNPRAVVVSILVLSNSAYQIALQNPAVITKLQTDFNTTLPSSETYSQYWNGVLNPASGTLDPSLPPQVRNGLEVFQRFIPLPVSAP